MRIGTRIMTALCAALLSAPVAAVAQRGPAGGAAKPRIERVTPATLETSSVAADVVVEGQNFASKAVVRIRKGDDRGKGLDYAASYDGPTRLRARVPADLLDGVGAIEIRVKNPDGATSDWTTIAVRAQSVPGGDPGSRKPVVDRVSPERLAADSRGLHVTVYGRDLADGAVALFSAGSTKVESRGSLVNGALVVPVPDELLAKPSPVILTVRNPGGGVSDQVRLDVIAAPGGPATGDLNDPVIVQVTPTRADMRNASTQRVELLARGVDPVRVKVLLRPEGSNEAGKLVSVVENSKATNGSVVAVLVTAAMVRDAGAYEFRLVNPNGRQSNWVRVEFLNGDPGVGETGAVVDARFPESLTLTAVTTTVPVEVSARNDGRMPVRLGDFAVVSPDGARAAIPGTLDVPAGQTRTLRLEAPVPLGAGADAKGVARVQLALVYKLTLVSNRNPSFDGRAPADGFKTVSIRNTIALAGIGREYVTSPTAGGPGGWRFFKSENDANAGDGKTADFYLFAEPFSARDRLPTADLYNYRPDDTVANNRGLFYLVLRDNEISAIDARSRERGTRLGFVATQEAPGLVPLYRWVLTDRGRTANHYVTVEKDAARLPRQMQQGGWKLDTVVGYVVPR
jgi:hypothetical protein